MDTVLIEKMTYGIDSLGHIDGKVVFVPYAAPSDKVKIKILDEKSDYYRAELTEIVEESPDRSAVKCKNFPECGGCHWLHILPERQRQEKEKILDYLLKSTNVKTIYPMEPLPLTKYRNKMDLKVAVQNDKVILGNYRYRSHDVVSIDGCLVQSQANMDLYEKLTLFMNDPENRELANFTNSITVRSLLPQQHCAFYLKEPPTQQVLSLMQSFYDQAQTLSRLEAQSSLGNHLTLVREKPLFNFMNRNWRVSPNSFFQNNLEGAEAILHTIISIYQSQEFKGKFLDLYCGVGTQSFLLESLFDEVFAVEANSSSYQDALSTQRSRSGSRIRFICRKVETIFNTPITKGNVTAVHVNPPRSGLVPKVIHGIAACKPKLITYLSCNPITFKRDVKNFKSLGYKLRSAHSFDLFPGTFHMEILGSFSR